MDKISRIIPNIQVATSSSLSHLRPLPASDLVDEISAMLAMMQSRSDAHGDMKIRVKLYVQDLADIDGEVLKSAIRRFRRGELGDGKWAPTSGEIRKAIMDEATAKKAILDAAEEQSRRLDNQRRAIKDQFAARHKASDLDTPEARQRASAKAQSLIDEMRAAPPAGKPKSHIPTEDEALGLIARYEAGERKPPIQNFSDKLCAQLLGEIPIGGGKLGAVPVGSKPKHEGAA